MQVVDGALVAVRSPEDKKAQRAAVGACARQRDRQASPTAVADAPRKPKEAKRAATPDAATEPLPTRAVANAVAAACSALGGPAAARHDLAAWH